MVEYAFAYDSTGAMAGPYSSEQFARFMLFSLAANKRPNAGVIVDSDSGAANALNVNQTTVASKAVRVRPGAAFVNGRWYYTDSDITLTIADNTDPSGFARIDYCVLRRNTATRITTPVILQGTPAGSPVAPSLTQTATIWEIPLATIAVANLFTSITDANITNSVREFARKLDWREGGTAQSSYLRHEVLMGQTDTSIAKELISTFLVERLTAMTGLSSGSWQTLTLDADSAAKDPDNLITISGNQITVLKSGYYQVYGVFVSSDGSNAVARQRIRDITNTATLGTFTGTTLAAATTVRQSYLIPTTIIIPADNTIIEIQSYHSAGTLTYAPDVLPADGETFYAMRVLFKRIGNL